MLKFKVTLLLVLGVILTVTAQRSKYYQNAYNFERSKYQREGSIWKTEDNNQKNNNFWTPRYNYQESEKVNKEKQSTDTYQYRVSDGIITFEEWENAKKEERLERTNYQYKQQYPNTTWEYFNNTEGQNTKYIEVRPFSELDFQIKTDPLWFEELIEHLEDKH